MLETSIWCFSQSAHLDSTVKFMKPWNNKLAQ
ncbi:MAG: hypothetical protein ACI9WR_001405 [Paracoccaceae bacterium]